MNRTNPAAPIAHTDYCIAVPFSVRKNFYAVADAVDAVIASIQRHYAIIKSDIFSSSASSPSDPVCKNWLTGITLISSIIILLSEFERKLIQFDYNTNYVRLQQQNPVGRKIVRRDFQMLFCFSERFMVPKRNYALWLSFVFLLARD